MQVRAIAMYLDDALGGMRPISTTTEISLTDNGGAEAKFNTAGKLIGIRGFEGGYSLSTTIEVVKGDPSEPNYWHLRRPASTSTSPSISRAATACSSLAFWRNMSPRATTRPT